MGVPVGGGTVGSVGMGVMMVLFCMKIALRPHYPKNGSYPEG